MPGLSNGQHVLRMVDSGNRSRASYARRELPRSFPSATSGVKQPLPLRWSENFESCSADTLYLLMGGYGIEIFAGVTLHIFRSSIYSVE